VPTTTTLKYAQVAGDATSGGGTLKKKSFRFIKNYIFSPFTHSRRIYKLVSGTVVIKVAAVTKIEGTDYTVDYNLGVLTFIIIPTDGQAVTATFEFDVPVRFDVDQIKAKFLNFKLHDISAVPLVGVRVE